LLDDLKNRRNAYHIGIAVLKTDTSNTDNASVGNMAKLATALLDNFNRDNDFIESILKSCFVLDDEIQDLRKHLISMNDGIIQLSVNLMRFETAKQDKKQLEPMKKQLQSLEKQMKKHKLTLNAIESYGKKLQRQPKKEAKLDFIK
jgi:hypothetical protein